MAVSSNFAFLSANDVQLARLGALAERYFHDDAPAALIKLRQLAEFLAKEVAARHALLPSAQANFDDTLRALKLRAVMPREIADLFYHLKKVGNAVAHENAGTSGDVLIALKMARSAAIWFHRTYAFKPGPFIPPAPPVDATAALQDEVRKLQQQIRASADAEAKAQLARQEAEAARLAALQQAEERQHEKQFWEEYATETEAGLLATEAALKEAQRAAEAIPVQQLDLLAALAAREADKIELDEATTRVLIDDQLRSAGWIVDSAVLRHGNGARPEYGKAMAIAEWPTATGPVDYALFVDGRCVGVIEAKREVRDVPGRLGQAKRYATGINLTVDELPNGGPWQNGDDRFRVPFLFVTNGRPYVKQLATKSGIWFWDARPNAGEARALPEWFSPRDLIERLEQETEDTNTLAEREISVTGLRPYQHDAISAVEKAVGEGQRHILLAMATGTGKTRLAIALMYELLRCKRFRRSVIPVRRWRQVARVSQADS